MANIFANTQVPQYSLINRIFEKSVNFHFGKVARLIALITLFIFTFDSFSQSLSTQNKKSIKLYGKAEDALIDRDFRRAIELFQNSIKHDANFRESYLRLATIYKLYQNPDSSKMYFKGYVSVTPNEKVSWKIWKNLAFLHFESGEYGQAKIAVEELLRDKPEHINDPELKLLKESIEFSLLALINPADIEVEALPEEVNSYQLQYFPVLTVDGGTLIYTKRDSNHPNADEDIVFSYKSGKGWTPSQTISKRINTELNEGACSVSADGRVLIFTSCDESRTFGNCDLFISQKEGEEWSKPQNMGSTINSKYWDSQPSLSGDGHTLYFSSNRPGGFGKRDLWVSALKNGSWSKPTNLGVNINSFKDETTPFIHSNTEALFYSSNSIPGLGGYDLFLSKKQNNIWGQPKNLGYPINSHNDEVSIFVEANGSDAYYSQEKLEKGAMASSRIVRFDFPSDSFGLNKSSYITGVVTNIETDQPINADLKLMNLNDSLDFYITNSDSSSGRYFLTVTEGKEYGIFVERKGFLFENTSFQASANTVIDPDTVNIALRPFKMGQMVTLQNIYFEFDQYQLNPKSIHELRRIVDFMKRNLEVSFEIEGHTDNQGSEPYNLALSQKRADAVKEFLIKNGITKPRLQTKGYGSSKRIKFDSSEIANQMNRRIVFRVLK